MKHKAKNLLVGLLLGLPLAAFANAAIATLDSCCGDLNCEACHTYNCCMAGCSNHCNGTTCGNFCSGY